MWPYFRLFPPGALVSSCSCFAGLETRAAPQCDASRGIIVKRERISSASAAYKGSFSNFSFGVRLN